MGSPSGLIQALRHTLLAQGLMPRQVLSLPPQQLVQLAAFSKLPLPAEVLNLLIANSSSQTQNLGLVGLFQTNGFGLSISPQGFVLNIGLLKAFVEEVSILQKNPSVAWKNPERELAPVFQLIDRSLGHRSDALLNHFSSLLIRTSEGVLTPASAREAARFVQAIPAAYAEGVLPAVVRILSQISHPADLKKLNDALENFQALPLEIRTEIVKQLEVQTRENPNETALKVLENLIRPHIAPSTEAPLRAAPRQIAIPVLREMVKILASVLPKEEADLWVAEVVSLVMASPKTGAVDLRPMRTFVEKIMALEEPVAVRAVDQLLRAFVDRNPKMRLLVVTLLKELVLKASVSAKKEETQKYLEILKSLARSHRQAEDLVSIKVRSEAIRIAIDLEQNRGRNKREMEQLIAELELVPALDKLLKSKSVAAFLEGISILSQAWVYLEASVRGRFVDVALDRAAVSSSETVVTEVVNLVLTRLNDLEGRQKKKIFESDLYEATLTVAEGKYGKGWTHFAGTA